MVWCCHKDDRAISGDVESTPRTYLSKEDTCDGAPEDEGGLVGNVGGKRERFWRVRHTDVGKQERVRSRPRDILGVTLAECDVGDAHVISATMIAN